MRRVLKRNNVYESLKKPPFIIPAQRYKQNVQEIEVFLCDLHIPFHNEQALELAYREMLDIQPSVIYLGGDVLDFHKISKFSKDMEKKDIADEIELTKCFFNQLRGDFPYAEIILEGGNHVAGRWERFIQSLEIAGVEGTDVDSILDLDKYSIQYVHAAAEKDVSGTWPKRGKLYHLHGDEAGVTFSGVNVARSMFQKTRNNTIFGHFHKTQAYYDRDLMDQVMGCWSVGCLCDLSPRWRPHNDWNHGFAVITYYADGTFHVENKVIIEGRVF